MPEVLVVDDDRTYRTIIVKALAQAGFSVSEAASGIEAMERMRAKPAAAIVTDIHMPDMDGLELIRTLRTREMAVLIVAVSGGDPTRDPLPAASLLGADLTFKKPLDLGALVLAVRAALEALPNPATVPD